jgi:hypothetical protein
VSLRRSDLLLLCAILAGFAIAAFIRVQHTAAPVVVPTPSRSSTDVTGGGYAAVAELLRRERVRVGAFDRRPGQLDDDVDTLIDAYAPPGFGADPATVRTDADLDDLRAWVARGGRLVVIGVDARVAPRERALLGRPPVVEASVSGAPFTGPLAGGIATLAPRDRVRFDARRSNDRVALADAGGPLAVDVAIGRGAVRYFDAAQLFANRNLARNDDARLAFALMRPLHPGGLVLFDEGLHGALVDPSWWSIMPVWLRVMLAGFATTVLLMLGGSALRLGPPIVPAPAEPTSAAFLDAVTALYERAGVQPEGT